MTTTDKNIFVAYLSMVVFGVATLGIDHNLSMTLSFYLNGDLLKTHNTWHLFLENLACGVALMAFGMLIHGKHWYVKLNVVWLIFLTVVGA